MSNGGIKGPVGGPRPFCRCEQLFTVQVESRDDVKTSQLDQIQNNLDVNSVKTRPARFQGTQDIVVNTGDGITSQDELNTMFREVRNAIRDTHRVLGWRIESV